jgi:post-segregation antitoxin (ccd killing protein)
MLKKVEKKVSLNIKISADLDARLKRARMIARAKGLKFNVSQEVEKFLLSELKKVEKELSCEQDISEWNGQQDLISEGDAAKR